MELVGNPSQDRVHPSIPETVRHNAKRSHGIGYEGTQIISGVEREAFRSIVNCRSWTWQFAEGGTYEQETPLSLVSDNRR